MKRFAFLIIAVLALTLVPEVKANYPIMGILPVDPGCPAVGLPIVPSYSFSYIPSYGYGVGVGIPNYSYGFGAPLYGAGFRTSFYGGGFGAPIYGRGLGVGVGVGVPYRSRTVIHTRGFGW